MSEVDEFKSDLMAQPPRVCAGRWVLERTPQLFSNTDEYIVWRHRVADSIGVDACDLVVTGSAAAGFSLSPYKSLKPFDSDSDIDVAVVSPYHFDVAWRYLRNLGAGLYSLTPAEQRSVRDHRERLIYWGTVATDRILPRLPFGPDWIKEIADMETEPPIDGKEMKFRLYRDFQALRAYQVEGLRKLREAVVS